MTDKAKDKTTMTPRAGQPRRGNSTRTLLLSMLLFIAFLVAFGYAALAVYQWAHAAALALPMPGQVSPPSVVLPAADPAAAPDGGPALDLPAIAPQTTQPERPARWA